MAEEGSARTVAAMLGPHEEVLEPYAGAAEERRERREEEGEPDRLATGLRDHGLGGRARSEQVLLEALRPTHDLVAQPLVLRQLADHRDDHWNVGGLGRSNVDVAHGAATIEPPRPA